MKDCFTDEGEGATGASISKNRGRCSVSCEKDGGVDLDGTGRARLTHSTHPIVDQCQPRGGALRDWPSGPDLMGHPEGRATWPGHCLKVWGSHKSWPRWGEKAKPKGIQPWPCCSEGSKRAPKTSTVPFSSYPQERAKAHLKGPKSTRGFLTSDLPF